MLESPASPRRLLNPLKQRSLLERLEAETVAAYEAVAAEYDESEHATTRALEDLGRAAWARATQGLVLETATVVEVGAGTGALSLEIATQLAGGATLWVTDASTGMLESARRKLSHVSAARFARASAFHRETFPAAGTADLIVCGLADPYFIEPALPELGAVAQLRASLFVSVPLREWAEEERRVRLGVPADRTRFRLRDGREVTPYSATYTPHELVSLLGRHGWSEAASGALHTESSIGDVAPSIAWALVQRAR